MSQQVKTKNAAELEAILEFYAANGVDCALDDDSHDRFAESIAAREASLSRNAQAFSTPTNKLHQASSIQAPSSQAPSIQARGQRPSLGASPEHSPRPLKGSSAPAQISAQASAPRPEPKLADAETVKDAHARAAKAETLDELRQALESFDGCNLKRTAKNLVFSDGNPKARLMFIGEAPGRDEDISGLPFAGRTGDLLNRMIEAIGLTRAEDVYIANIVPWRPPGNRAPTPQETALCLPFIERQIALVKPDILVPMGAPASRQLLKTNDGIMKLRGRTKAYALPHGDISIIPTLHPSYLLRQPGQKRLAWQDFLLIKQKLEELSEQEAP